MTYPFKGIILALCGEHVVTGVKDVHKDRSLEGYGHDPEEGQCSLDQSDGGEHGLIRLKFEYVLKLQLTEFAGWVWNGRKRVRDDSALEPKQLKEEAHAL